MFTSRAKAAARSESRAGTVRRARQIKLGAAFVLLAISGLVWNSFALFLVALETEFSWSRAQISGAYGAFALINALTAPLVGYSLSRWDSRRILALFSLILGVALCASAASSTITQYWLAFGLVGGIGAHCTSSFAIFAALASRFREKPATAMAIADAGSGLAAFIGLPLIYWVISDFGWRTAYLMLGAIVGILAASLHLLVIDRVRRSPRRLVSSRWTFVVPSAAILALAISYFCGSAAYHGLLTQQIALFDDRDIPEQTAVWIAATAGFVVFGWRLVSGWLCDLFGSGSMMGIAAVAAVTTFVTLGLAISTQSTLALLPLSACHGCRLRRPAGSAGQRGKDDRAAVSLRQHTRLLPPGDGLGNGLGADSGCLFLRHDGRLPSFYHPDYSHCRGSFRRIFCRTLYR